MPFLPPPAAVEQPPQQVETHWKLSLYGVQRTRAVSTRSAPEECGGERGTYRIEREVRFSSARAVPVTIVTGLGLPWLLHDQLDDQRLKGSATATVEDSTVVSSCSDLNPDGSPKWVPRDAEPAGLCDERRLRGYTATVRWNRDTLTFNASGGALRGRDPQEPSPCSDAVVFPTIRRTVPLRRLLASGGKPVKVGVHRASRDQTRFISSETTARTTVYVQLRRVG